MQPYTRAIIAASTFAAITGKTVAGIYDHTSRRNLKIAAECRGNRLQGFDGERGVRFGGTLPELYDEGEKTHVSFEIVGDKAKGHDRASASDYSAHVEDGLVQLYDYAAGAWFAYDIQGPNTGETYHRDTEAGR
ncbi:hypothetical protein NAP1_00185 [Erythrobacter sp. NAP1]|uniref:hypothetical protein n=1 Tax=Erythrobacter sp. NAP1 TaxID=237727 RepID=UPI0000686EC0|nr:hypothetical protein [Erythrobacter sp. NAP1]EAQ29143.1 hypothetical protein NAP1_00185 [Erythrobacter sp. NAP1]